MARGGGLGTPSGQVNRTACQAAPPGSSIGRGAKYRAIAGDSKGGAARPPG
jgi:hypothetical protein